MTFGDDIIAISAPEPSDLDRMFEWENDPSLWGAGDNAGPLSRASLSALIDSGGGFLVAEGQARFMIRRRSDGATLGIIDFFGYDLLNSRVGVGILIGEEFRGSGYAKRALDVAGGWLGGHHGMHQIWALVAADNAASLGLFASAGYKATERRCDWLRRSGGYVDAVLMQKLLT